MKNSKRFVSLKTKIMISTLVPVIISYLLVNSIIFVMLFNSVNNSARAEFLQISEKYTNSFESKISDAMNYLAVVAGALEQQVAMESGERVALQKMLMYIFDSYELLDGSSIYFEPNMYDNLDEEYIGTEYGTVSSGRICYYYYRSGGKTEYLPEALEDDVEFELPHYTDAKKANRPIYTDPVIHEVDGKEIPMFTLTYPIKNVRGEFIGAVTVDIFLEDLYDQLQEEKIYETGYIVVANDKDQVIYSPRFEDIGKTRFETGYGYSLPGKDETSFFYTAKSILNGKTTLLAINTIYIPRLDSCFYICVSAPINEINAQGIQTMAGFVLFSLFIVAFIGMLIYYRIGRIYGPIKEITENVNKIAKGSYSARIKGDYNDEFDVVKDSVNMMADSIEAYIKESGESLNILKSILNGIDAFIYVTVPKTGEILFINERLKEHFSIEGDCVGQKCYKVLQEGFDGFCDFCPCFELDKEPGKVVVWEEHGTLTNRDYRNTDCYIDWIGGDKVHLQHSVDITDLKNYMNDKLVAEREALELKNKKEKAEAEARAKNDFLAKMSHEIRTPMNAVMGMSELILRKKLPQDIYENALGIKSASANLLSIINDILDFSKIESGRMEIIETDYLTASLVNDVIGIIRIRLIEKPISFVTYIDACIPKAMHGDIIRIRQILLNLLSNAVKYTVEGSITLTITGEITGNTVNISFGVRDTGNGIKEEDIEKLFGDFTRIDTENNQEIEGTGLGLAITQSLSRAMGGDVTVESEYGKGSVFTASFPQSFETYGPFASVDNPGEKSVLLYETRKVHCDAVVYALESLNVDFKCVETIPALFEGLNKYPYVFISSFLYDSVRPVLLKLDNPPCLVLLADVTEAFAPKEARILSLPAHSLSVANILNDVFEDYDETPVTGASFTAPEARVLIVDDITANLKVAEGLMSPYEMQITTCVSGREALRLVEESVYDLVFMDHMMPDMDGIEATGRIRDLDGDYYKKLPIVALTANAVSGVKEMFVQNGMNDFLAKPIETVKLDAILEKWIPKEKRKKIKTAPHTGETAETTEKNAFVKRLADISGLNVDKALSVVGGSSKTYERIVKLSARLLPANMDKLNSLIETDLPAYSIEVHGFKGVLYNIGAYELGDMALELENASKDGEASKCRELHYPFMEMISAFNDALSEIISETESETKPAGDKKLLKDILPGLTEAADFFNSVNALSAISTVDGFTYGEAADTALDSIKRAFESFDFDRAMELIDQLKDEVDRDE